MLSAETRHDGANMNDHADVMNDGNPSDLNQPWFSVFSESKVDKYFEAGLDVDSRVAGVKSSPP
jgi:hypothetical protein